MINKCMIKKIKQMKFLIFLFDFSNFIFFLGAVKPFMKETNLNGTEITIDINTHDSHNSLILQCFVGGMPKPIVKWYKVSI